MVKDCWDFFWYCLNFAVILHPERGMVPQVINNKY